ncbi:DUF6069 family protein [Actinomadura sp. 3N407]|uniref:DUF6069 family protein n=1 Tax=Actinomadura sp. 3N407 TaxID=3457423 RepID=UPI003FCC51B2
MSANPTRWPTSRSSTARVRQARPAARSPSSPKHRTRAWVPLLGARQRPVWPSPDNEGSRHDLDPPAVSGYHVQHSALAFKSRRRRWRVTRYQPALAHRPHAGSRAIGVLLIIGFTLVISSLGWCALALLEHYTRRVTTVWSALAIAILLPSFAPILLAGASTGTKTTQALIHLTVARRPDSSAATRLTKGVVTHNPGVP